MRALGEDARDFLGWFAKSRFLLMERMLDEMETHAADEASLRGRFLRCTRHARRVQVARALVTLLLAAGILAAALAAVGRAIDLPTLLAADVARGRAWLERVAAISGSASVLLLGLRLAFDRYLEQVETTALFLAMRLAAARG